MRLHLHIGAANDLPSDVAHDAIRGVPHFQLESAGEAESRYVKINSEPQETGRWRQKKGSPRRRGDKAKDRSEDRGRSSNGNIRAKTEERDDEHDESVDVRKRRTHTDAELDRCSELKQKALDAVNSA